MMVRGRFFSLLIIFGRIVWGGNCEVYKWEKPFNETVLRAACLFNCSDEPCITNCTGTKQIEKLNEEAKAGARLICRDEKYLVLAHNTGLFVIETFHRGRLALFPDAVVSDDTQVVMSELWPQAPFKFRLYRIFPSGISMPEITESMETFPVGYRPMEVTNITIGEFEIEPKQLTGSWRVNISFTPAEDRPCYYEVRCQQYDGEYNELIRLTNEEQFSVTFRRLPFATDLAIIIEALTDDLKWDNSYNIRGTIASFSTPRCYYVTGLLSCTPKAVNGLNATAIHKKGNIFDVYLTWDEPEDNDDDPSEYSIDIHPIGGGIENRVSRLVGRDVKNVVIRNVTIKHDQYDVYIRGVNLIGMGPLISKRFTTGLKRIAAVEGLNATVIPKVNNTFDILVTWEWPEIIPDFYIVNVTLDNSKTNDPVVHNISGSTNETIFSDVEISEEFNVSVGAWSSTGRGTEITQLFIKRQTAIGRIDAPEDIRMAIYLTGSILIMVICIGIAAAYKYYGIRKRRRNKTTPVDEFEMNPDRLTITRVLGTGAFGLVKFATLRDDRGNVTNVAVKMLQDDSNENYRRNFLHEIKIMKAIDQHPNIVCLLGCSTTGPYPFLVVEYCSRGDLQSFLRKSLEGASSSVESGAMKRIVPTLRSPKRKEILRANARSLSMFRNNDNYVQSGSGIDEQDTNSEPEVVTVMDMLNFGRQIATGMEFLSSSRVIHRDLAARNILVGYNRTVKISDFGLSRDIYKQNIYKKSGNGQMPLKWMAIEALTHQVYTTYSDVWSFGVLLWEIMTRGGEPYPGIPILQILKQLQFGYRMERPANCSIPLYNVMRSCWQTRPKDRPTFTILRQELDKLICATTKKEYFDLNDIPEEMTPQDDDLQISTSRPTSYPLQAATANDLEPRIATIRIR